MKKFILYCIIFFAATSICAFAHPHGMHGGNRIHTGHSNYRYYHGNHFPGRHRSYHNERFHVYESSYQRNNYVPIYCDNYQRLNTYNSLCNPKRRFMPTHTLPFYGIN